MLSPSSTSAEMNDASAPKKKLTHKTSGQSRNGIKRRRGTRCSYIFVARSLAGAERTYTLSAKILKAIDMFPIAQIRVARPTNNLAALLRFYEEGLAFQRIGEFKDHEGYTGVMLGMPDAGTHLEFTEHIHPQSVRPPTRDNLLVFYFKTRELRDQYADRLRNLGFSETQPENPYWLPIGRSFEDPDGWGVVLVDRPDFDSSH